jgi:hypothetical protein
MSRHPRGAGALLLSLGLVALPARATPPSDRADAEGLAATAAVLVEQGDYVHACAKYDASARLDPNARRYLKLADCFERAGMIARAWMAFGDAQEWAESRGDRALAQTGRDNIKRLEPKLARIAVVVPPESEVEGLRVTRDGALVSAAVRGVPVVVDSGAHVISAGAPGRRAWSTTIELSPGKTTVSVVIPILEERETVALAQRGDAPDESRAVRPPADGVPLQPPRVLTPALARTSDTTPEGDPGKTQRTAAWIIGGVGMASIATATIVALQASAASNSLNERCPGAFCNPATRDDIDSLHAQERTANVLIWGGLASLGGAAILYFTAPSATASERATAAFRVAPSVAPSGAGIFASGRF